MAILMSSGDPLRLLLVEDSASDAALLRSLLGEVEDFPFELDHAPDLASAQSFVAAGSYEAILLDLGLPDSSGFTTYEKMRARAENSPIIIVTGNEDRTMLNQALKSGADNYLIKDAFDGNRIAVAILAAIRNRTAQS